MKEEKEKAEQEKEEVAQAVPVIENLNNFAYMVSVNFSMIKVQLIDIKRQKNSQAAAQSQRKDGLNPPISSSLCLEVCRLGAFYHQFWERNALTIQNKSLVVREQKHGKHEANRAKELKGGISTRGPADENNFIQIRGSKELKMR